MQGKVDSTWQSDALPKTHSTQLWWQAWNRFENRSVKPSVTSAATSGSLEKSDLAI